MRIVVVVCDGGTKPYYPTKPFQDHHPCLRKKRRAQARYYCLEQNERTNFENYNWFHNTAAADTTTTTT